MFCYLKYMLRFSGCPKTSFSCNDWQRPYTTDTCVPLSQRCDGKRQCASGKDEMDCNILTPSYIEGKNVNHECNFPYHSQILSITRYLMY